MGGAIWGDHAVWIAQQLHYAGDTPRSLQPRTEPGFVGSKTAMGEHDYDHDDDDNDYGSGRNRTGAATDAAISLIAVAAVWGRR